MLGKKMYTSIFQGEDIGIAFLALLAGTANQGKAITAIPLPFHPAF